MYDFLLQQFEVLSKQSRVYSLMKLYLYSALIKIHDPRFM